MKQSTLVENMESLVTGLQRLRDDVKLTAADAYLGGKEDDFAAYESLKKRIDQELPRLNEITYIIQQIENGGVNPIALGNAHSPVPKEGFRKAFLDSLRELGGQARVKHIMNLIEEKMRGEFTEADYKCDTPSDPERPRWKSHVYGLIPVLVSEGLISSVTKGIYKLQR